MPLWFHNHIGYELPQSIASAIENVNRFGGAFLKEETILNLRVSAAWAPAAQVGGGFFCSVGLSGLVISVFCLPRLPLSLEALLSFFFFIFFICTIGLSVLPAYLLFNPGCMRQ